MADTETLIVGLDIGSTKVAAVIGEVTDNGVEVIGVGTSRSEGLRQGFVVNIEATTNSIREAIEVAEQMAGVEVQSVYVGIAGGHIRGFESLGQVSMRDREVAEEDVLRVIDQAKAVNIPLDQRIIHTLPLEYVVDGQGQVRDPVGISGVRMEVKAHILTASATAVDNITKCCNRAGLDVIQVVLEPLASAEAVLDEDEMDLGVVLIDVGGGTTDISVYSEGRNVFSTVLVMGSQLATKDAAYGLKTSVTEAEQIKVQHGCALESMTDDAEVIEVPGVGPRPSHEYPRAFLARIIESRMEEILLLAQESLVASGYLELAASGIVLTGGAAQMQGMSDLTEDIFDMEVRVGKPIFDAQRRRGLHLKGGGFCEKIGHAGLATAVGLVLFGARGDEAGVETTTFEIPRPREIFSGEDNVWNRMVRRVREIF